MTIDELNEIVESGDIDEFIRVCEARQCKALSKIADRITDAKGVRLVLLTGGSSAGKTTTAKRLCTQLRVNGAPAAMHLSTDDYFVGNARNPRDANGDYDYETIEAVDRARLVRDLTALLGGEPVRLRRFDFVAHDGFDAPRPTHLPDGGVVVLEGLHALNPQLVEGLPAACGFRLFIEPKTQLEIFATTRLSSRDARLVRRLVRDHQFRKMEPMTTFRMWPKVLAGEEKWIDPFRGLADAEFDSALEYELAVLKPYVAGLLARVLLRNRDEARAQTLSMLFEAIVPTDPVKVPGDSILRETIGGSLLEY